MEPLRDIKRRARRDLHEVMQIRAVYLVPLAGGGYADPVEVTVRLQTKWTALGDMKGTNFHYAERQELAPRIIFLCEEVSPKRGAVVSIEAGEAYRVDNVLAPDDLTVTCEVVKLAATEVDGLPVPGGGDGA
jgi:hypothetical protein